MVVFTDPDTGEKLTRRVKGRSVRIIFKAFDALDMASPRYKNYWEHDFQRDPERHIHRTPYME